jgi:hypothetical protein
MSAERLRDHLEPVCGALRPPAYGSAVFGSGSVKMRREPRHIAEKPTYPEFEPHPQTVPGQIGEGPAIPAVNPRADVAAGGPGDDTSASTSGNDHFRICEDDLIQL